MLAKKYRLQKKDNVLGILKKGNSFQTSFMLFKFLPNREVNSRFSVIVSRKVTPAGIQRNTLRRRIYEAVRLNLDENKIKQHLDTVILPSKKALAVSYQEIEKNVLKFLTHII